MSRVSVKDVHDKDQVKSVFQVARKATMTSKGGKQFLAVVLRDKTGELDARVWDKLAELDPTFDKGDLVEIEGPVTIFQGHLQLRIDTLTKHDGAGLDPDDFAPPPKVVHEDRSFQQISEMVDRLRDPYVKALLRALLDDEALAADFKRAPAARAIHHAAPGGLCEHTLSAMRLAQRIADHYPMADRDLLIAGAFLHGFGRIHELSFARGAEHTDEGRLVGHLVITAQLIHERAARIEGFPPKLETHLVHLVLAHHGTVEYGSPRVPQTIEALLLHDLDEMDSRLSSWLAIMQRDPNESWTEFQKTYDRHLFKGPAPTEHGRPPVERRPRAERKRPRPPPRETGAEERAPVAAPSPAPDGNGTPEPRVAAVPPQRRERARRPDKPAEKLTFKPFAALSPPPAADAEPPPSAVAVAVATAPESPADVAAAAPASESPADVAVATPTPPEPAPTE